jgi:hypothetical protein
MLVQLQKDLQLNTSRGKKRNDMQVLGQNLTDHILPAAKGKRIFSSIEGNGESPSPVKKVASNIMPGGYLSNSFY